MENQKNITKVQHDLLIELGHDLNKSAHEYASLTATSMDKKIKSTFRMKQIKRSIENSENKTLRILLAEIAAEHLRLTNREFECNLNSLNENNLLGWMVKDCEPDITFGLVTTFTKS